MAGVMFRDAPDIKPSWIRWMIARAPTTAVDCGEKHRVAIALSGEQFDYTIGL
jgi:hypothetical protein